MRIQCHIPFEQKSSMQAEELALSDVKYARRNEKRQQILGTMPDKTIGTRQAAPTKMSRSTGKEVKIPQPAHVTMTDSSVSEECQDEEKCRKR